MEINTLIPKYFTEKLLTSFQKRILQKLQEPTRNRIDLHEALKMDTILNPCGDSIISEDETSFITNVDSYDIFSNELENTEMIKDNILNPTSQDEKVQSAITSSIFSVSRLDLEQKSATINEKCVKIKIILPKKQQYSPLLAENNSYRRQSTGDDNVGKIVEELVLERYRHFFVYYENKKKERNKRRISMDYTTDVNARTQHEKLSQNTNGMYSPLIEETRHSESEHDLEQIYSSPQLSQDYSVSDCEISDLLTTKYATTDKSLSPCPTYTSIPDAEDDKDLSKRTIIQDKIIHQISRVIEFCKLNRNLQGYVEAERLLLLADYEKKLNYKSDNIPQDLPTTGIVTISNLSVSADEQDLFVTAPSRIYYVCVFTHNKSIVSSGSSTSDQDGRIRFNEEITIKNLSPDFVIEASLYALRLPECFLLRGKNMASRRLFASGSDNCEQKKSKSSFCLIGTFNLNMEDVGRVKHVSIRNMIPEFVIISQGKLQMKCDVLDTGHSIFSFVDLGFRIGNSPIRWNRLWGTIGKMDLKFWKYPDDNPDCPVVTINLQSCLDKRITNVDHDICLRPRTLRLEVEEPNETRNYQNVVFLLSFDTLDDMIEWKDQLNCLIPWIKKM